MKENISGFFITFAAFIVGSTIAASLSIESISMEYYAITISCVAITAFTRHKLTNKKQK